MNYLPEEAANDPMALHKVFIEMQKAYASEKRILTKNESETFIRIMLASNDQIDGIFSDLSGTFPIGAFFKRMELFPIKFEKKALVLIGALHCNSGIGGLILIGYYLEWLASIEGKLEITEEWVFSEVWPFGVFSEETIHKFWDKQKVKARPDNLIDHASAAQSFLKTELA